MSTTLKPTAAAAVYAAQILAWRDHLPILRAPRILDECRIAERARKRPRRAVLRALDKAIPDACHLAAAKDYRRGLEREAGLLPLASSYMEDRLARTPYFYRQQALSWWRYARRGGLISREKDIELAKSYLASYRERLADWNANFQTSGKLAA